SDKLVAWFLDKLLIEVILYRNNKFEGKKVLFYINTYTNQIIDIKITEQVSEDEIALYPISPSNPFEMKYDDANVVSSRDYDAIPLTQQPSILRKNSGENIKDSDAKNSVLQKLLLSKSSLFKPITI
ncbi:MAG: hypothetical protein EBU66_18880, partial [Bacteroidetes bacterium]|nr:hypothetical protein [Bacteroidota bacterium]